MYLKIMKDYKEDDIEDFKLKSNTNDQAVIINSYKYAKIYWKTTAPYSIAEKKDYVDKYLRKGFTYNKIKRVIK